MSKAGLHAMTQSLAVEWGRYGIRFNAIAPGPFPTKGAWERLSLGKGEDYSSNPMGRPGQMHELCNLAVFLLAPGAEYVDGQTIAIDGAAFQATGANFSGLRKMTETQWEDMRAAIKSANDKDKAKRTV
jgi:NAD(P)-dependent dehydrogenase (short-subunit alcohol dehydrogenase family)